MFASPAFAQSAGAAPAAAGGAAGLIMFAPWILVFVIMWFLVFRPQQQRAKQQREAIAAVKKGDQVVTAGGVVGKVTRVDESEVEVEIAPSVRIKVVKATLGEVRPAGTGKPAND